MKYEDLVKLYSRKKKKYGADVYKHISEILREAKKIHKRDWEKKPTKGNDHEQSWRSFKGKNLEKLLEYILKDGVENLGLKLINGNKLDGLIHAPDELMNVKRNLAIHYGKFGLHLPDVDIVIYKPETQRVLAVISSKVTLRERVAQSGYWKLKLYQDGATKHIKVYFITPDEDGTLAVKDPIPKGRAIVEMDLDGSYVLSDEEIDESGKVKYFSAFMNDLKALAEIDENDALVAKEAEDFTPKQKEQIFRRDDYRCVICGRGRQDDAEIYADRIMPDRKGDKAKIVNGQTLCAEHHAYKKNYTQTEIGKKAFVQLYELAKTRHDEALIKFFAEVLEVFERNDIGGRIEWKR